MSGVSWRKRRRLGVTAVVLSVFTAACSSSPHATHNGAAQTTTTVATTTTTLPTQPPTTPALTSQSVIAHDQSVIAADYGNCAAFSPSGCSFTTVSTSDGTRGTLLAVLLHQQFGDGTGRAAVFFFHGTIPLIGTPDLPPRTATLHGPGLEYVTDVAGQGVRVTATGEFAVTYVVSSGPNECNACVGNDGTDTYVYGWNGTTMVLISGVPPKPPSVIGEG